MRYAKIIRFERESYILINRIPEDLEGSGDQVKPDAPAKAGPALKSGVREICQPAVISIFAITARTNRSSENFGRCADRWGF